MAAHRRRLLFLAPLTFATVAACSTGPTPPPAPARLPVVVLDLQVRNAGIRGGYIWLSPAGQPDRGRWHEFGMADFFCVTCPEPLLGSEAGYDIAVIDLSCGVRATYRSHGGQLLVDINSGPTVTLVPAPPVTDWLPRDSTPADRASIPCASPP